MNLPTSRYISDGEPVSSFPETTEWTLGSLAGASGGAGPSLLGTRYDLGATTMVGRDSGGGVSEIREEPLAVGALGLEEPTATRQTVSGTKGSDFACSGAGKGCGAGAFREGCGDSECCAIEIGAPGADTPSAAGSSGCTTGDAICGSAWGFAATRSPNWMIDAPNCRR